MLYQNLYLENATESCDIRVENGVFTQIAPALAPRRPFLYRFTLSARRGILEKTNIDYRRMPC